MSGELEPRERIAPTHQQGRANVPARGNRYSQEQRQQIVDDALARIADGDPLAVIAATHGITVQTLHTWLSALGDEYRELRQMWLDSMLAQSKTAIDSAPDQFELARAREQWRYSTWYAERRDPARYGARVEHSGQAAQVVVVRTSLSLAPQAGYVVDAGGDDGKAEEVGE